MASALLMKMMDAHTFCLLEAHPSPDVMPGIQDRLNLAVLSPRDLCQVAHLLYPLTRDFVPAEVNKIEVTL